MSKKFQVIKPEGYQKIPLPFFNEWVEALESGNYKQGQDWLFNDGSYCCLGVLCQIQRTLVNECDMGVTSYCLHSSNPCFSVLNSLGNFPEQVTVKLDNQVLISLAELNDEGKFTFEEIAEVIKEIWKPEE